MKAHCCVCTELIEETDYYDHMDSHGDLVYVCGNELIDWNMQTIEEVEFNQFLNEHEYFEGVLKLV